MRLLYENNNNNNITNKLVSLDNNENNINGANDDKITRDRSEIDVRNYSNLDLTTYRKF